MGLLRLPRTNTNGKAAGKIQVHLAIRTDRDHTRQDTLTTWVVYLAYEYRFQDQDASYIKFSQCRHDEAWEKLVDSSVLRNGETYGAVCDIERVLRDGSEEGKAEKDLPSAMATITVDEACKVKVAVELIQIEAPALPT